jgi:hypothetical protein
MPVKKTTKKATKTEAKPKKGKKVKKGQAFECGLCGFRFVIDDCGGVEEHYFICCSEPMKQKRATKRTKKAVKKTEKKAPRKTAKKTTKKK